MFCLILFGEVLKKMWVNGQSIKEEPNREKISQCGKATHSESV